MTFDDEYTVMSNEINKIIDIDGIDLSTYFKDGSSYCYTLDEAEYDETKIAFGFMYLYYMRGQYDNRSDRFWVDVYEMSKLIADYNAGKTGYNLENMEFHFQRSLILSKRKRQVRHLL